MPSSVFVSASDRSLAGRIRQATRRVALAAPAIRDATAAALQDATVRLGTDSVSVVVDCDDEVFRLGYGSIDAVQALRDRGVNVRQSSGLRVGVLVCDEEAIVFAPTALYVQEEVQSDETPNAMTLCGVDVDRIAAALFPTPQEPLHTPQSSASILAELAEAEVEIGQTELTARTVEVAQQALAEAPPIAFDIARQVRVFEPYIQYVDIKLIGCHIERRTIELPQSIQGLDQQEDLSTRIHTKFDLIEKSASVSSKAIDAELKQVRDDLTRSLGKPWGRVILRAKRSLFDERIKQLQEKLCKHQTEVKANLATVLSESLDRLAKYYFPLVKASPPDKLRGQVVSDPPTDEDIQNWLAAELATTFPEASKLVTEMTLDVQFRDVTYETLNENGFAEALRSAYPYVDWDRPFNEFDAAKARDSVTITTEHP